MPSASSADGFGQTLPFAVRLDDFSVELYSENGNVADYKSSVTIADIYSHDVICKGEVAMNKIMVYVVALHERSLPWLRSERAYHLFIALSFLVLLMICFGVNMLLSGLHSYA